MEIANQISQRLKRLHRADRFIFEEQGSNDLHIGWPIVRGKFSDGTWTRCPLLFFPVSLQQDGTNWTLRLREDAEISLNKSFLLAYAFYNQVKPVEALMEASFDEFDSDSVAFRTQLYNLLRDKLEINFNPDIYFGELMPFEEFKRDEFDERHRTGELKLFPEAVLGIFPQAGSQLVPDYLQLLEQETYASLESFFESRTNPELASSPWSVKEEKIYTPMVMDAFQEHAIRQTKVGKSIVVQGPPGTGKSQLIANLLADAIASGKRALLVCQKRVALDVVYDRLQKMDLGDFLGLVHDFRNDRKTIYEKIARQINRVDEYRNRNRSTDIIHLERKFTQVCRTIDQVTEELEEFRKFLFDEEECGLSVKELYLTSSPHAPAIAMRQEYQYFTFHHLDEFLARLRYYTRYAAVLEEETHPWRIRNSFATYAIGTLRTIEKVLEDLIATQTSIHEALQQRMGSIISLEDCENLLNRRQDAEEMLGYLRHDNTWKYLLAMIQEKDEETSLLWLQNMERVCMNCFDATGVETTLPVDQVGVCQKALHERVRARRNIFKRIRWELFSDHKFLLKRVLVANQLPYTQAGFRALEDRIDNRLNLEHHLTALKAKHWLTEVPQAADGQSVIRSWFEIQKSALQAKLLFNSLRELRDRVSPMRYSREAFCELIREVFTIISTIPFHRDDWQRYLSPFQIRRLTQEPGSLPLFLSTLRRDFDNLCAFDTLKESLQPYEADVIARLHDEAGSWEEELMTSLFQNSVRLAWIEHLETKHPILRSVSTLTMDAMENSLQKSVEEKKQLSKEITLLRARERVYESMQYNRLNNPTTYRDLLHQVTKKKLIWPVRKTIATFHDELFNLLPCWLASPEAVSAIFPMESLFDVVIFDEASQCFSERGIPAMHRGKQVVVVGDSRQLKPFDLYQVRWETEEDSPDAEVDSLLSLAERYLPTIQLQGHYRSQSPDLIRFSNQHFYGNNLQLLPNRSRANSQEPCLEYRHVNGHWKDQTNEEEASAVVAIIQECTTRYPGKSIGVVTFNAPQQVLIQDKLDDLPEGIPNALFVKNIENIQGDERDIIIFSIGYAPDKKGKMNMQFGSLNVAGGENRLNVAVTRARERIVVVASIWPEALAVENVRNNGPILLRAYLEYVRAVSTGMPVAQPPATPVHQGSWYLKRKLLPEPSIHEWQATEDPFPSVDLAVRQSNQFTGIVLTDDMHYQASLTVKDPQAYLPQQLLDKDWRFIRVYSRTWWMDPEQVRTELRRLTSIK